MKNILLVFLFLSTHSFATTSEPISASISGISKIEEIRPPQKDNINFKNSGDRFMFGCGLVGQSYGLIVAMMDGSAQAHRNYRITKKGFITGLTIWTIVAVSTSVVVVPIIYGIIYGLPTIAVANIHITSAIDSKRFMNNIETAKQFQLSSDTLLTSDSFFCNLAVRITYDLLPRKIRKNIDSIEGDSVINIYKLSTQDQILFGVETRESFGMTYNYSQVMNEWIGENQNGHRIQYYNKKGNYLMTRWINKG